MPKQKSSASSATRKKHARKQAARVARLEAEVENENENENEVEEADDGSVDGEGEGDGVAKEGGDGEVSTSADVVNEKETMTGVGAPDVDSKEAPLAGDSGPRRLRPEEEALTPTPVSTHGPVASDRPPKAATGAGKPLSQNQKQKLKRENRIRQEKSSSVASTSEPRAGGEKPTNKPRQTKKDKSQSKKESKKNRPKQYIPPPPPPTSFDPLSLLDPAAISSGGVGAETLITLRKLGKKDEKTVGKGLEEFGRFVRESLGLVVGVDEGEGGAEVGKRRKSLGMLGAGKGVEELQAEVLMVLPVWIHHLPSFLLHPSRRIRLLSTSIQSLLISSSSASTPSPYRSSLLSPQYNFTRPDRGRGEEYLTTMLMSSFDGDKAVRSVSRSTWDGIVGWEGKEVVGGGGDEGDERVMLDERVEGVLEGLRGYILDASPSYQARMASSVSVPPAGVGSRAAGGVGKVKGVLPTVGVGMDGKGGEDEGLEENEDEGRARKASWAVDALGWIVASHPSPIPLQSLTQLLKSNEVWEQLSTVSPSVTGTNGRPSGLGLRSPAVTGVGSPVIRRSLWGLVESVYGGKGGKGRQREDLEELAEEILPLVSRWALYAAWNERDFGTQNVMWGGLLSLLRSRPRAWVLADEVPRRGGKERQEDEEDEDEDDSKDETDEDREEGSVVDEASQNLPSPVVRSFLTYLQLGGLGSPSHLHSALILILPTIPSELLPFTSEVLSTFFDSIWAAKDGRAVNGREQVSGLAKGVLECLWYVVGEWVAERRDGVALEELEVGELARGQVARVWDDVVLGFGADGRGRGKGQEEGGSGFAIDMELGSAMKRLAGVNRDLFVPAWEYISNSIASKLLASALAESDPNTTDKKSRAQPHPLQRIASALVSFSHVRDDGEGTYMETVRETIRTTVKNASNAVKALRDHPKRTADVYGFVTALLGKSAPVLLGDGETAQAIDDLATLAIEDLIADDSLTSSTLAFLTSYLRHRGSPEKVNGVWKQVLRETLSSQSVSEGRKVDVVLDLVDRAAGGDLSAEMETAGLDDWVGQRVESVVSLPDERVETTASQIRLISQLASRPTPFIQPETVDKFTSIILARFGEVTRSAFSSSVEKGSDLVHPLRLFMALLPTFRKFEDVRDGAAGPIQEALVSLFLLGHVLDPSRVPPTIATEAQQVWSTVAKTAPSFVASLSARVLVRLRALLGQSNLPVSALMQSAHKAPLNRPEQPVDELVEHLIPTTTELDRLFAAVSHRTTSPALCIIDELSPSTIEEDDNDTADQGPTLQAYVRYTTGLLYLLSSDRQYARSHELYLKHVLTCAEMARDEMAFAGSVPAFSAVIETADDLHILIGRAEVLASYVLTAKANDLPKNWHGDAVANMRKQQGDRVSVEDTTYVLVRDLLENSRSRDAIYARRALRDLLSRLLRYSENASEDAERWLALIQTEQDKNPELARAILYSTKDLLYGRPRFDRYVNELASDLATVRASQANQKGARILSLLIAAAPSAGSDAIFLPQQRTINAILNIQRWIAADDVELDESMFVGMARLLVFLAPIVQDLSGSHWDFIFDIVDTNLEAADLADLATLPAIWHATTLLQQVQELASSNGKLREETGVRMRESSKLAMRHFLSKKATMRNLAYEMVMGALGEVATSVSVDSFTTEESMSKLVQILADPSLRTQLTAYHVAKSAVKKRTDDLVVEAELEKEKPPKIELPAALLDILQIEFDAVTADAHTTTAYLLSWMLAFDHFEGASPLLRTAYIDQCRGLDLVNRHFMPTLLALTAIGSRGFDPSPWSVDTFLIEEFDPEEPHATAALACHLYFRSLQSVPSLIRSWWQSVKSRQLSQSFSTFTSRHFSPILIKREFTSSDVSSLNDENMSVKIATAVNEVKAVYTVDEQQLELVVKLPNEFPLVDVEVRDAKKGGVTDREWRSWILGVQQMITNHNGLLLDALRVFKQNVSLHFEGVEACAICYSIISTVDRSLPNKECRTCKNKFHPSCLYKWFTTSASSTCPLCRTIQ